MTPEFSVEEALTFGWNTFKAKMGFFIGLAIVSGILLIIPWSLYSISLNNKAGAMAAIFGLIAFVVELVIMMGWIGICLKMVDGQDATMSDLMGNPSLLVSYVIASIIVGLVVD